MKLLDIMQEMANVLDVEEQLTDEQQAQLQEYLGELETLQADKVDAWARFLKRTTARAEAKKAEAKRLTASAKQLENLVEASKTQLAYILSQTKEKKLTGEAYAVSLRKSVAVKTPENASTLPEIFRRVKTTIEADKAVIKEALTEGVKVEGCELVENFSLQIK